MTGVCEHGSLARQCLVCELTAELKEARHALLLCWSFFRGRACISPAAEWAEGQECFLLEAIEKAIR